MSACIAALRFQFYGAGWQKKSGAIEFLDQRLLSLDFRRATGTGTGIGLAAWLPGTLDHSAALHCRGAVRLHRRLEFDERATDVNNEFCANTAVMACLQVTGEHTPCRDARMHGARHTPPAYMSWGCNHAHALGDLGWCG